MSRPTKTPTSVIDLTATHSDPARPVQQKVFLSLQSPTLASQWQKSFQPTAANYIYRSQHPHARTTEFQPQPHSPLSPQPPLKLSLPPSPSSRIPAPTRFPLLQPRMKPSTLNFCP
ncbi:hypothetical protein K402DRAFT_389101 [Aulographum hederae CBS 113979]|uniref:Uncharacterized protein n=1 Tax=Aulographum hederae CBS 113979 TaxID=1176131 RepID=A0A6G1HF98_9PEZI|nr:hypothetical protein K402DRAFT_389101 [Aulographum hederae CBS 113979]